MRLKILQLSMLSGPVCDELKVHLALLEHLAAKHGCSGKQHQRKK